MSEQDALEQLQALLKINAELVQAQNRANELKEQELALKHDEVSNQARTLDLEAQRIALEKERLKRAEARLHEVLNRYVGQAERADVLLNYMEKHTFNDDALCDFLEQFSKRFETVEHAAMLTLMAKLESPHVRQQAEQAIGEFDESLTRASKQRQRFSYQKSLNKLEEQRAEGDSGVKLLNEIDRIRSEIARLEEELK